MINTLRHSDILKPNLGLITIVGAGGIGSPLTVQLAKMGFDRIKVFDGDEVDEVNLSSQLYRTKDIGKKKVFALAEIVKDFADVDVLTMDKRTDGKDMDTNLLILAVDDIDVRKEIVSNAKFDYLIDGRMAAQTFSVFSFPEVLKDEYMKTIFPKEEAVQLPCSGKAICYNTFGCSSFIANMVKRLNNGEHLPSEQSLCYVNLHLDVNA